MTPAQRGQYAELQEQLNTRKGAIDALKDAAINTVILAQVAQSYCVDQHQAGKPLDQGALLSVLAFKPDQELVACIEDGYQHLNDYDALGRSPLVGLFSILTADHLERSKLVHKKLIELLDKLKPPGKPPPEPLPRAWYAYTILHDSYVNDSLSRDIMGKLYIGEGTYYRLRRQALRGITRAGVEMGAG